MKHAKLRCSTDPHSVFWLQLSLMSFPPQSCRTCTDYCIARQSNIVHRVIYRRWPIVDRMGLGAHQCPKLRLSISKSHLNLHSHLHFYLHSHSLSLSLTLSLYSDVLSSTKSPTIRFIKALFPTISDHFVLDV